MRNINKNDARAVIFKVDHARTSEAEPATEPAGYIEFDIADWSMADLSSYLADRYDMSTEEADTLAAKTLRAFKRAGVSPHAAWFCTLPKEFFLRLTEMQRRFDLFQHAVDSLLALATIDHAGVSAIAEFYKRFLTEIACHIEIEKRQIDKVQLMVFAQKYIAPFDVPIDPVAFANVSMQAGLLVERGGFLEFGLNYVESFFVARALLADRQAALRYLVPDDGVVDANTL